MQLNSTTGERPFDRGGGSQPASSVLARRAAGRAASAPAARHARAVVPRPPQVLRGAIDRCRLVAQQAPNLAGSCRGGWSITSCIVGGGGGEGGRQCGAMGMHCELRTPSYLCHMKNMIL